MHAFWSVLTYDLLEDRHIDDVIINTFLILYYIKQIDSKLPCICSAIDHRWHQNVVRTSVTHSAMPCVPLFCSYHILTSSVIYYWTDAQQLGIYLLTSKDVCTFYVPHTTSCQVNLHDMISEYYINGSDLHSMTQTVSPIIISIATQTSLSVLTTFRITSRWLREGLASNSSAGLIFLWVWEKWCLKNKAFPLK